MYGTIPKFNLGCGESILLLNDLSGLSDRILKEIDMNRSAATMAADKYLDEVPTIC